MRTLRRGVQLATLDNLDLLNGPIIGAGFRILDLLNNVVALQDLAKDNMTTIKPTGVRESGSCIHNAKIQIKSHTLSRRW